MYLPAPYYIMEHSTVCHARKNRQDLIWPTVNILITEVEEIIIFVEVNRFHVDMKVVERVQYTRDANTNIAWTNYNVIMRERLLCYKIRDEREQNCCYVWKS
jgi:hypothetical protein